MLFRLRTLVFILLVGSLLAFGLALLRYVSLPGDVVGSAAVEFARADVPKVSRVWRTWGGNPARTRVLSFKDHPPYRVAWTMHSGSLIELPPAEDHGALYFGTHSGRFYAVSARTGQTLWQRQLGRCTASSPTVADGVVYVGVMGPAPCRHPYGDEGGILALDAQSGNTIWQFKSGLVESSPLLVGHMLYFGAYRRDGAAGDFYAVDVRNHQRAWRLGGVGKVAGAASYRYGRVYFASYNGQLYALQARSGTLLWRSAAAPVSAPFSARRAGFYATPALAYGRVYIGGIDGRVYSFGREHGDLRWVTSLPGGTGARLLRTIAVSGNIYASAAVYRQRVFVGSADHRFYALDASSGKELWHFAAAGKIIGSPTVMDGLVYFSTTNSHTYALDIYNGQQVWSFADGGYSPLLADSSHVYLVGQGRLYGLEPSQAPLYGPHIPR